MRVWVVFRYWTATFAGQIFALKLNTLETFSRRFSIKFPGSLDIFGRRG